MKLLSKIYWQSRNFVSRAIQSLAGGTGLLAHRKDIRDFIFGEVSVIDRPQNVSIDKGYRFDQNPFNICVFASRALGRSMQNNIRLSVRWDVKVARKMGWLSGNGWSYLRAENDLGKKIGCLPYELMPDETIGFSWEEYSKWTEADNNLLPIAAKFKIPNYYQVQSRAGAVKAIDEGRALFTAGKWYYEMNRPHPPKYMLEMMGGIVGGHAFHYPEYYNWGDDFGTVQTFGEFYGDNGKARVDNIFGSDKYAIYVEDDFNAESHKFYLLECCQGKAVKGINPPIYLIDGMEKRAFKDWDSYKLWCEQNAKEINKFINTKDEALALIPDGEII